MSSLCAREAGGQKITNGSRRVVRTAGAAGYFSPSSWKEAAAIPNLKKKLIVFGNIDIYDEPLLCLFFAAVACRGAGTSLRAFTNLLT